MSPDGDSIASICMMQDKAQQCINDMRSGHLHHRNFWFSLKVHFWLEWDMVYAAQWHLSKI
jgi:hypothetical protein